MSTTSDTGPRPSRRQLLGAIAAPAVLAGAAFVEPRRLQNLAAVVADDGRTPEAVASDESFWRPVQAAFAVDRSVINLNNGAVSPAPAAALAAQRRLLAETNDAPAYELWKALRPRLEEVRRQLAAVFGCSAEEIALTRNATESLETLQLGLDLRPGDEVLTTTQDYPWMVAAFQQRARRQGIVLRQLSLPVPTDDSAEIVRRFADHLTPRTRLILLCHVVNLTGQILPVAEIVRLARGRGVPVIVDGAHAFAHLVFTHADLDCDFYASSLHKWLCAPIGTGMLYVRRRRISEIWPLLAAPERLDADIRKFEVVGTRPLAAALAAADALAFHLTLGAERKLARLLYLRDLWAKRLAAHPRIRLLTSLAPGAASGMATFAAEGMAPRELVDALWNRHRILVAAITHPEVRGVRVSPSVYTTTAELDRFCSVVEALLA